MNQLIGMTLDDALASEPSAAVRRVRPYAGQRDPRADTVWRVVHVREAADSIELIAAPFKIGISHNTEED